MPQHKSALKRIRTSSRRRARNRMYKSRMKNLIKQLHQATDRAEAEGLYKKVTALLDRIATKGVIHPNAAANRKSKLAKLVNEL
ncbi:MAG: 30S ribosomal protein S20 [Bacteroidota bacterium]|nr:30S ribosomal protein S20 [Bacteroidota bacterium]